MSEKIRVLIDQQTVEARIAEVAEQINRDYEGKKLHLVGILKGSVMFMCEMAKHLTMPVTMDFMSCSSYDEGTVSKGIVRLNKDLDQPIEGKDVLLVEDIIDSGNTLAYLLSALPARKPASLKLCTLPDRQASHPETCGRRGCGCPVGTGQQHQGLSLSSHLSF